MPARKTMERAFDKNNKAKKTIEYSVYIHLPANQNKRFWEKTSTTEDGELALEQAEMLYYSKKYPRVEVMRKFFCEKQKKCISERIRIFDSESPKDSLFSKVGFSKFLENLWKFLAGHPAP